jgi:flagellar secretion chaperone FliS
MKNALEAKLTYRENAVRSATPIELVVILFDTAIDDMRRAAVAARASDIEERAAAIRHAMVLLQQLQGTLDFEKGGQVARQFEQFYNLIRAKLLEWQLSNSPELIQQQIQFMSEVRDCWAEAERRLNPKPAAMALVGAPPAQNGHEEGGPTSQWSA